MNSGTLPNEIFERIFIFMIKHKQYSDLNELKKIQRFSAIIHSLKKHYMMHLYNDMQSASLTCGMDNAMLRVNEKDYGEFPKLDQKKLIRDADYPIRVTYQFYKVTDLAELSEYDFEYINDKINNVFKLADSKGSLVFSDYVCNFSDLHSEGVRITETVLNRKPKLQGTAKQNPLKKVRVPVGLPRLFNDAL